MGWDGSGNVTRTNGVNTGATVWQDDRDAGTKIRADLQDVHDQDLADAIENSVARDGQNAATANLPMGGFKHTNVADGTARNQYTALGQIQDGDGVYAADTGSADTYAIAPSPGISAYAAGQQFRWKVGNANTGASTLNVNSLGAKNILWPDGTALSAGDLPANAIVETVYDGTQFLLQTFSNAGDLGTAATKDTGTSNGQIPVMDATGYPAADGSQITNIPPDASKAPPEMANNATDAAKDIDFSAGYCRAENTAAKITNTAMTKQLNASWSAGDNQGGLSSSLHPLSASAQTVHCFAVIIGGSADFLFDTDPDCANGIADHSVTAYRRIGSILTDATPDIIAFSQYGDEFLLDAAVLDQNGTIGTTAANVALSVPSGVKVWAKMNIFITKSSAEGAVHIYSPDTSDQGASRTAAPLASVAEANSSDGESTGGLTVRTDTSSQVRVVANTAAVTLRIATLGWIDRRGRDA